jgi:hypothetical protein
MQQDLYCDPSYRCPKYVSTDSPEMKKLQIITSIKFSLLCLMRRPEYSAPGVVDTQFAVLR